MMRPYSVYSIKERKIRNHYVSARYSRIYLELKKRAKSMELPKPIAIDMPDV